MIKLKISITGKKKDTDIKIDVGESLADAVERSLVGILHPKSKSSDHFVALVNGLLIEEELWDSVKLKESDNVLISPKITDGDTGTLFKTAVLIVATVYLGPEVAGYFGATSSIAVGLVTAGVTIATTLLLNSLIPPPVPKGLGDGNGDLSGSQMYSISGQSNTIKQFQSVAKVYGTMRVFPTVAANPYSELQTDPVTGQLVQYFYCIYDFGLGPVQISNLKIGDTPIESFSEVQYSLIDYNKPDVAEGVWDNNTIKAPIYYKGRIDRNEVGVAINKDYGPAVPLDQYQVTRNATPNTTGVTQQLTVTMACPQGLFAFSNAGAVGKRTIFLTIEFAEVGTEDWHGFNDDTYVSSHLNIGGSDVYGKTPTNMLPPGLLTGSTLFSILYSPSDAGPFYPATSDPTFGAIQLQGFISGLTIGSGLTHQSVTRYYGLLKGTNQIYLQPDPSYIGRALRIQGEFVGYITADLGPVAGTGLITLWHVYTLDRPLARNFSLWKLYFYKNDYGGALVRQQDTPLQDRPAGYILKEDVNNLNKSTIESFAVGRTEIQAASTAPVYATFQFTPKVAASYKVRITRTVSFSDFTQSVRDALTWAEISTRSDEGAIKTLKRHTFMELKIRATDQLNGAIQNLSGECSSILDVYDPNTLIWSKQPTSNPAWALVDILTGEINKRAFSKDRLDLDSIVEWADFCDEIPIPPTGMEYTLPRFQTNVLIDYAPTLQTLIQQVMSAGQASLNIVDGKYGALIDKLRTTPVQIFTTRNSSNFTSQRNYTVRPDAIKVSYIDPAANWEVREAIVYDTGFDATTAEVFDDVTSYACTNAQQAWRFGRYLLFQNRLRQESITLTVDFESLACSRGDYVQIAHDVMKVGGTPARVKSITGNRIVIDDAIETLIVSYGYTFRAITGEIQTNTLTVISDDTFDLDGSPLPEVGDLIIIGEIGQIVIDCLVKAINPGDNFSATLTLVEKADAIYTAESSDSIPDYSPQIAQTANADFQAPGEVQNLEISDSFFDCTGSGLDYKVTLTWGVPLGSAYEAFEIYVDFGSGFSLISTTKHTTFTYTADPANLGINHSFKVLAVSATGKKLDLGSVGDVEEAINRKTTPPSDVTALNIDITGETVQLFWIAIPDCACREYMIRYSPLTNGTWAQSIPLLKTNNKTTTATTQARTGTYLIKAIDFEGNESFTAAAAITTIPNLFGLNVIDQTTDFPTLPGTKNQVVTLGGGLILADQVVGGVDTNQYYSEGFYYYQEFLDLGDIYTVRLQSLIQAEGYTLADLMASWTDLASLDAMTHAGVSDWDVETHYRTTDSFNVIADWPDLTSIDPISEGDQDNWTAWKKFNMGDATGRIFQFRLKLISNKSSVTPRVFDGTIKSDMPDRVESYNNISAPNTGYTLSYDPPFKGPGSSPNVQITIDGASSGDYWTFTSKTLNGFTIQFYDKTNAAVARQFDASVKGYGHKAIAVI